MKARKAKKDNHRSGINKLWTHDVWSPNWNCQVPGSLLERFIQANLANHFCLSFTFTDPSWNKCEFRGVAKGG